MIYLLKRGGRCRFGPYVDPPLPSIKAWPLCSSQWMKGHKVWLKPNALWTYKQARWMTCCCGIFCSRFHPILSPLKIILEMIFWTNLMLDLICTWLEKTGRFCRQVNKKISSCFWTASTCVQRSSLGWCSRLTYMETVDWIHVAREGGGHLYLKLDIILVKRKKNHVIT